MSPEQIRGQALDVRADVYAFGCMIHELLAGKPPFTGVSANELLKKHLKQAPPSIEMYEDNVTVEFAQLVRSCLAKKPQDRPQALSDFLLGMRMTRVYKSPPKPPKGAEN
jgi:serine/threonine protein kinase